MSGVDQGINLIQFLIDNLGAVATLLVVITLVPVVMVFILYSILKKQLAAAENQRKEYGSQISRIGSSINELIGVLNGFISVFSGNIAGVLKSMQDNGDDEEKKDKKEVC